MRILLTGFDPWGDHGENPSGDAVASLDGVEVDGAQLCGLRLPVVWGRAAELTVEAARRIGADAVLMTGLAAGRAAISVERVFVNRRSGRDSDGVEAREEPVVPGGTAERPARLPVEAIVAALAAADLPAEPSASAGTYVCNATAYAVLHRLPEVPAGFLHLPATPALEARRQALAAAQGREVVALPTMDPVALRRALRVAAGVVAQALAAGRPLA